MKKQTKAQQVAMVTSSRVRRALLIATTFLVVQTAAAVHELQHALHHHDNPSCPMHVYADHFGKTTMDVLTLTLPLPTHDTPPAYRTSVNCTAPALGYYTRGPPRASS